MSKAVPITMGSPRSRSVVTETMRVTDAWFPPGAVLERHTHAGAIFGVMVAGSFETRIAGRALACSPSWCWTEPAGEAHENRVEAGGARVLVLELDHGAAPLPATSSERLLGSVNHLHDLGIAADARRALAEAASTDGLTPLVLQSLAVLILARAARIATHSRHHGAVPGWLLRVKDRIHSDFRQNHQLSALAAECSVDPVTLARGFQRHFGKTPGEYARAARLDWALQQLVATGEPISMIALRAGFSDQSHFTRACSARVGMSPAAYRKAVRQ